MLIVLLIKDGDYESYCDKLLQSYVEPVGLRKSTRERKLKRDSVEEYALAMDDRENDNTWLKKIGQIMA